MKKIILFASALVVGTNMWAQQYSNKVFIGFKKEFSNAKQQQSELKSIADRLSVKVEPSFSFTQSELDQLSANALKNSGSDASVKKLTSLYTIVVPEQVSMDHVLSLLNENKQLEYVEQEVYMPAPPADIPPTTPSYSRRQGYLRADSGIYATYAWSKGIFGQNVTVFDVEYGVNLAHEKLEDVNVKIHDSMTVSSSIAFDFSEHGTATIGVVCADKFEYGTVGAMHGIEKMTLVPEMTEERGYNRLYAVQKAISSAKPGDVIMYEMQIGVGSTNDYVPADYSNPIWNATKAAVDAGIVIVAAAGNGNVDLDYDVRMTSYKDRGDNGSIIVGAGSSDMEHKILTFSTFGERVNLQGWGANVGSPGYGYLSQVGNDTNQFYTLFSGTSSATPIVSSAVIAVQSYYYSKKSEYLNCRTIRDILVRTGTPQGDPARGKIGPIPNILKAFAYVDSLVGGLSNKDIADLDNGVELYPNPSNHTLNIKANGIDQIKQVYIFDAIGRIVYAKEGWEAQINISALPAGDYQYMILDKNYKTFSSKFVKL